jgi:hypothetical protein
MSHGVFVEVLSIIGKYRMKARRGARMFANGIVKVENRDALRINSDGAPMVLSACRNAVEKIGKLQKRLLLHTSISQQIMITGSLLTRKTHSH